MASAQERAQALALQMLEAVKEAKAAEDRARALGDQVLQALAEAKAEAEAARTILEYPSGRYECKGCGEATLFTEPMRELPACGNCGGRDYDGHEPKIIRIEPPPPKKYPAGIYECGACGARIALPVDADALSACELCGADQFTAS